MMSNPSDGALPPDSMQAELPAELQDALKQAFNQSLGSLDSLRITLRRHVHAQRRRGASLGDIDTQVRQMVSQVETNSDGDGMTGDLATQIAKWTRSFFSGTPS